MVPQGNLVAAQVPGLFVQVSPAHAGAEIAGGFGHLVHNVEDIRMKNRDRDAQGLGVGFDKQPVQLIVSRIHDQENQLEGEFPVPLQLLKELRHQHGVLSSGNADGDPVPGLQQVPDADGLGEGGHQVLPEPAHPPQGILNLLLPAFPGQVFAQPGAVAFPKADRVIAPFPELLRQGKAPGAVHAEKHQLPIPRQPAGFGLRQRIGAGNRAGNRSVGKGSLVPDIHQHPGLFRKIRQFLQGYFRLFHFFFLLFFLSEFILKAFPRPGLRPGRCGSLPPHTAGYTGGNSSLWPSAARHGCPARRSSRHSPPGSGLRSGPWTAGGR